jgi:hypothetical protein
VPVRRQPGLECLGDTCEGAPQGSGRRGCPRFSRPALPGCQRLNGRP